MTENFYKNCKLCPRNCGADRRNGFGYCGSGNLLRAARAGLHFYEEPYLSGTAGSGTVFFTGCSLGCIYCQNYEISERQTTETGNKLTNYNNIHINDYKDKVICEGCTNAKFKREERITSEDSDGKLNLNMSEQSPKSIKKHGNDAGLDNVTGPGIEISVERLAEIFIEQQKRGANNINLVTGTHFTPSIAEAIRLAKYKGLTIPTIWNCSGYEKVETLQLLEGLIDIWLPDFKTLSPELGKKYMNAPDYPDVVKDALDFMINENQKNVERYFKCININRELFTENSVNIIENKNAFENKAPAITADVESADFCTQKSYFADKETVNFRIQQNSRVVVKDGNFNIQQYPLAEKQADNYSIQQLSVTGAEAADDWIYQSANVCINDGIWMSNGAIFKNDLMIRGVNVRHLVLPGSTEDSKKVIEYLHNHYGDKIWISIMSQYTPVRELPYKELNRKLTKREYDKVINYAIDLGVENALIQEGDVAETSFIPKFDGEGIIR